LQGYKTFPIGLLMAVIQFYRFILCGSCGKRIFDHMMLD
jgi:hypothetical protein